MIANVSYSLSSLINVISYVSDLPRLVMYHDVAAILDQTGALVELYAAAEKSHDLFGDQ